MSNHYYNFYCRHTLGAKNDLSEQYQKEPYNPIGKNIFNISAKECKVNEIIKYLSAYYWAIESLSHYEQVYINEYFFKSKIGK